MRKLKKLFAFCTHKNYRMFPVTNITFLLFIVHCLKSISSETIKGDLNAIIYFHKRMNIKLIISRIVCDVLKGANNLQPSIPHYKNKTLSITSEILEKCFSNLNINNLEHSCLLAVLSCMLLWMHMGSELYANSNSSNKCP